MGKIAVVTGASSGLGREYVKLIDKRGQRHPEDQVDEIWVIARRKDRLEELQNEVRTPLRPISLDLTKMESVDELSRMYEEEQPQVLMLVNSAGFGKIGSYADISMKDAAAMVDLNCKAPVLLCQATIPYMTAGARILNVCSTAGFSAFQYLGIYSASKSFFYRYSRSLRVELLARHISVTAVCPYWVKDTEFIPVARMSEESGRKKYIKGFPLAMNRGAVASWSMGDTWRRFAVSTPGPVCFLHRIFGKLLPSEIMMGIWEGIRRI